MSDRPDHPFDPWARPADRGQVSPWGPPVAGDESLDRVDGLDALYGEQTDYGQQTESLDTLGRAVAEPGRARRGRLVAAMAAVALVAGLVGGGLGAWLTNRQQDQLTDPGASLGAVQQGSLSRPPDSVAGIARRVLPVVVSIDVRSGSEGGTGSGFLIRGDGYVLTNNHVVAAAAGATITVRFNDGSSASGRVVGTSPAYDLAVVKVARAGLPVATLGDSDAVVVGDQVIAIGSPLGLAGTVTTGIVSAVHRPVTTGADDGSDRSYLSALQTDAAINPGNSGGPLVDGQARVIGVNSAIATLSGGGTGTQSGSIGLGFSIPINQARRVAEQLIRTGSATYPVIGAGLDQAYSGDGVRLQTVRSGGPAAAAGLRAGDVVISVDGSPVDAPEDLIVDVRTKQPGDTVTLQYVRGGTTRKTTVTLGEARG